MTAPAVNQQSVVCPKCQGPVWDQQGSKFWGNGLFKSGKQKPRWECKNKDCGGAIWDKASDLPKPPAVKTQLLQARSAGTPDFLPTEGEEQAELQSRFGADLTRAEAITAKQRVYSAAMKQAVAYVLKEIEPLYTQSNIGLTGDEAYKHAYSIYATWCDKGLVE